MLKPNFSLKSLANLLEVVHLVFLAESWTMPCAFLFLITLQNSSRGIVFMKSQEIKKHSYQF